MARRQPRRGCRKLFQSLFTIAIFAVLLLIAGGWFFWRAMRAPYKGYAEPSTRVEVRRGQRTATILEQMQKAGVLRDQWIPLVYMQLLRRNDSLKAGVYEFRKPLSAVEVVDKLVRGEVVLKTITVREGLDRFAVAKIFAAEGLGTEEQWNKVTSEADLIRDIAPDAESLEGYLFPDTYKFDPGTSAATIVNAMVANFRKHWGSELATITTGLDPHQTVTLASIVETEAQLPQERPVVASVYMNRVRRRMLLGADPTVIYAMKLAGRWNGNIRKADLQMESPYNTYRTPGLPPGPIANPGLASLRAAAAPATTPYLYFVARNDGSHVFATSNEEHNRNVEKYQRQYFRDKRKAEKK
ncbi:MAG TPA: endolytic transglycosylase MltG [Thermoanaerobaculia bacterium]|nr:endolytic transglycosylase MltG [Thermoanaerobaculia bacterium]